MFKDNSGAIEMAVVHKWIPRTKHLATKLHHFQSYVNCGEVFGTWYPLMDHRHFNGPGVIFEHSAVNLYLMVKDVESFPYNLFEKLHKWDGFS